jgi:DNA-binding Xre family transcriptional regulator
MPRNDMIRFKIRELIEKKSFQEGRRITLSEVSEETGIKRMTLSRIINHNGGNTGVDNVDKLCSYFQCPVEDLMEHVPSHCAPDE